MKTEPIEELRYPMTVATVDELRQAVLRCPWWAVRKFGVDFEGKRLGYDGARQVLRDHGVDVP